MTAASKLKIGVPVPDRVAIVKLALMKMSLNAFDRHPTVVADVHADVRHTPRSPPPPRSSPAVTVCSPAPNESPDTVTDAYPLCGAFSRAADTTAASKLKIGRPVPDTAATVTLAVPKMSPTTFDRHATVVADVHDDVKHTPRSPTPPRSSPAVAVCSPTPKSSPDTVTDAYPLCGAFSSTSDTTAASKLKIGRPVPATDATVMLAALNRSPIAFDTHATVVADAHDDVTHTPTSPTPPRSSPAVAVCSPTPKLRPDTVSDAYPLCGAFRTAPEMTAASKLKAAFIVPATPPTVNHVLTCDAGDAISSGAAAEHLTVVAVLQLDVRHAAPDSTRVCVCSAGAKSSPVTVTDAYPLSGVFSSPYDKTGPSKLKPSTFVPATVPTVTTIDCSYRWLIVAPMPRALPA